MYNFNQFLFLMLNSWRLIVGEGISQYLHSGKDFFYRRQRILLLILKKEIGREERRERMKH